MAWWRWNRRLRPARERGIATPTNPIQQGRKQIQDQHTAAALLSETSNSFCCYCQQTNSSDTCRVVMQVDTQKQGLRRSGRCLVCPRRDYIGWECHLKFKCPKYSGRQHFICLKTSTRGVVQPFSTAHASNKSTVNSVTSLCHPQRPDCSSPRVQSRWTRSPPWKYKQLAMSFWFMMTNLEDSEN